jgi:hypothetical protein
MLIPANSSAWFDTGVEVSLGQALECLASGVVIFAESSESEDAGPLSSSPATFEVPTGVYTGGTYYSLPEGAYPPSYVSDPTFNLSAVLQTSALASGQIANLAATNCVPFSLTLALVQVGAGPPPRGIDYGLQTNRDTTFTASEIQSAAVGGNGPWRVWLIFNSYDYSTSSGDYAVTLSVLNPGAFDMGDRFTVLNRTQMGMESTPGTIVPATRWIQAFDINPSIKTKMKQHRSSGSKRGDLSISSKEWVEAAIDGIACYNHLPLLFSSLVSAPTSSMISTGVYNHTQVSSDLTPDVLKSFSVEHGTLTDCEKFGFGMIPGLAFKSTRDDITMSGTMFGQIMQDPINNSVEMTTGANEQQSVTITGATGGTFTLTYLGQTTSALAFSATTGEVQTALQALSTIGSGNATVSGSAGAYVVTFAGALAGIAVQELVPGAANLTPAPPTSTIAVVVSQPGGITILAKVPVMPGDFTFYATTSWAGLGVSANVVARQFETDWAIEDRTAPFWTQNASLRSFAGYAERAPKESIKIVMGVDTAYGIRNNYQQGELFYVRLGYVSEEYTIGTSGVPYGLTVDACVAIDAVDEYKDEDGIYALGYTLGMKRDPVAGLSYRITTQNGISGYTV